jgi:cytosine/adenosine deaminase-related metal-dependent hydrolase
MRYLTADLVFDGNNFLKKGSVIALDESGVFEAVVPEAELETERIERFQGCLLPGFVNAHCHLELSHLLDVVPQHTQLPGFAMELMKKRGGFSEEFIYAQIEAADDYMWQHGIVAVGDICNTVDTIPKKKNSKIVYHSFIELIALKPSVAETVFSKGIDLLEKFKSEQLSASFAAHAPYSVSPELAAVIGAYNRQYNLATSIHNQESPHEAAFLDGKASGFNDLYEYLKLDISYFIPPHKNGLELLHETLVGRPRIFVHNTFTSAGDIALAADASTFWCMCPKANLYIENTLPDYKIFPKNQVCIGTDSLASNDVLNIVEEVNVLAKESDLELEELLRAITSNGARALGIDKQFGSFVKGFRPGVNLLDINERKLQFIKKVI